MKKKVKKLLKVSIFFLLATVLVVAGIIIAFENGFFKNFATKKLDENLLTALNTEIEIYDKDNNLIKSDTYTQSKIKIEDLPKYVPDAFIAIEDKDFYKHNGVNYKSLLRALYTNIKTNSFSQGGSTISQQLIKNTHLSNEKSISRKVNEMLLTQELEKKFDKKDILQAYLNVIYFGQGTFGIEQASQKYFSKSAKDLNIAEAATLAGIINSPLNYSPISNYNNCKKRRNLVLQKMYLTQKITKSQLDSALNKEIELNMSNNDLGKNNYNYFAIKQASEILNMREQDVILGGYKIYTHQDINIQNDIKDILNKNQYTCDKQIIVIDNKTNNILAYVGNSNFNLYNKKIEPGSIIKPVAVYAPALEEKIITTISPILDDKINIDGYTPKNFDNKYHGWVSIKESLAKSYNVPAVKLLKQLGINKSKKYLRNFGIDISKDNGYSIALGGLTEGVNFINMANSYTAFANKGNLSAPSFVKCIKNKYGRTVYLESKKLTNVISEDNAYLITDMLKESVNSGTAKKLKEISTGNIASKTGTAGSINGNTDIWNISYTPKYTTAVWLGKISKGVLPDDFTGGNQTTLIAKQVLTKLDDKTTFVRPRSIEEMYISTLDLKENNKVMLAGVEFPDRYKQKEIFSYKNKPTTWSEKFKILPKPDLKCKIIDGQVEISFVPKDYIKYEIYINAKGEQLVDIVENVGKTYTKNIPPPKDSLTFEIFIKYGISDQNSQNMQKTVPIKLFSTTWS